jgi:putative membrane protein
LVVAVVLGLANALVRPVLKWLSCGLVVLTLGLFLLVINALMLLLSTYIARAAGYAFYVDSFLDAVLGSLIISVVSFAISLVFTDDR